MRILFFGTLFFYSCLAQPVALRFQEDLRLTSDKGDKYLWVSNEATVSADAAGRLYVADTKQNRLLLYDAKGNYLSTMAKEGKGPGEFQGLLAFQAAASGEGSALEMAGGVVPRLHKFNSKQQFDRFVAQQGQQAIFINAILSPTGQRFAGYYLKPDSEKKALRYETALFDSHFNKLSVLSSVSGPLPDRARMGQASYWVDRIAENVERFFQGTGLYNFNAKGTFFSANSNKYEITRWSEDLKTPQQVFTRQLKPRVLDEAYKQRVLQNIMDQFGEDPELASLITASVLRQALEKAKLPASVAPLFAIIPMEDGGLLAVTQINFDTRETRADVFSPNGQFIGTASLPDFGMVRLTSNGYIPKLVFRNGMAYVLSCDESGENSLVRYKFSLSKDASKREKVPGL